MLALYLAASLSCGATPIQSQVLQPLPKAWSAPEGKSWTVKHTSLLKPGGVGTKPDEIGSFDERWLKTYVSTSSASPVSAKQKSLYALFFTLDQEFGWSKTRQWKQINGWVGYLHAYTQPLPHARNVVLPEYLVHEEDWNPRHDFASFMSWYFSVQSKQGRDSPLCRYLSHTRFANTIIREADASFPIKLDRPSQHCKAFTKWAKPQREQTFEIGYASPLTARPSSLFGHIFLRIVYDPAKFDPIAHGKTVSFMAQTGGLMEGSLAYTLGGLFGTFRARLEVESFMSTYERYVINEGRDISRWRLNLSQTEQRNLLERLWTVRNTAEYDYFFLQENCSTLLIDTLNAVLPSDRQVIQAGNLGRAPTKALDQLFYTQGHKHTSLLTFIPKPILSAHTGAAHSKATLQTIQDKLNKHLKKEHQQRFLALDSDKALVRTAAYNKLEEILAPLLDQHQKEIRAFFLHRGIIESYFNSQVNQLRSKEKTKAHLVKIQQLNDELPSAITEQLLTSKGATSDLGTKKLIHAVDALSSDDNKVLLKAYEAIREHIQSTKSVETELINQLRQLALIRTYFAHVRFPPNSSLYADLFLPEKNKPLTEQSYLKEFETMFQERKVSTISPAIFALQKAKASLFAKKAKSGTTALAKADFVYGAQEEKETARYKRSYGHGRIDTLAFSLGIDLNPRLVNESTFALVFNASVYDEALGAPSRHGYKGTKALTILKNESWWTIEEAYPKLVRGHLRLAGFREISSPELALESSHWGWEVYADLERRPWETVRYRALLGTGVIAKLFGTPQLLNHLFLVSGVELESRTPSLDTASHRLGIAVPTGIEARVTFNAERNTYDSLSLRAGLLPFLDVMTGAISVSWRAKIEFVYSLVEGIQLWGDSRRGIGLGMTLNAIGPEQNSFRSQPDFLGRFGIHLH